MTGKSGRDAGSAISLLRHPKARAAFWQMLAVALFVLVAWTMATTAAENLRAQNIASGFGFLDNPAGFGIIQHLIPYTEASSYGRAFLVGLTNTLLVAAVGIVIATLLGFSIGIARLSDNWLVSKLAEAYVEIFRNTPLLLQIFFWYFAVLRALPAPGDALHPLPGVYVSNRGLALPKLGTDPEIWASVAALGAGLVGAYLLRRRAERVRRTSGSAPKIRWSVTALVLGLPFAVFFVTGLPARLTAPELADFNFVGGVTLIPEFVALTLALAIYTASFIAEIVRAGILSVAKGQREAANALGLPQGLTLRLVILPQALRVIVPPLTSQYLNLTKNSSLAVAIGYPDLVAVFAGTVLNQTGQAIEVIALTMAVYLTLSLATALAMNWFNARTDWAAR